MHFTSVSRYGFSCKMSHSSSWMYQMTSGTLLHEFIRHTHQLEQWRYSGFSWMQSLLLGMWIVQYKDKGNKGNQILINSQRIKCRLADEFHPRCRDGCFVSTRITDPCVDPRALVPAAVALLPRVEDVRLLIHKSDHSQETASPSVYNLLWFHVTVRRSFTLLFWGSGWMQWLHWLYWEKYLYFHALCWIFTLIKTNKLIKLLKSFFVSSLVNKYVYEYISGIVC